jgi:hypothetical protein
MPLALRLSAAVGWGDPSIYRHRGPMSVVMLFILILFLGAGRIRDVLRLQITGPPPRSVKDAV